MNKTLVKIIIIALSIALIGLVYIQVTLIKSGVKQKEQQFNQSVYDAMNRTAQKIEENTAYSHVIRQQAFLSVADEVMKNYFTWLQFSNQSIFHYDSSYYNIEKLTLNGNYTFLDTNSKMKFVIMMDSSMGKTEYHFTVGRIEPGIFFLHYNQLLGNISETLFHPQKEVMYNRQYVESVLNDELTRIGIKTKYEFALIRPFTYSPIFSTLSDYNDDIANNSYSIPIYNNATPEGGNILLVYFPKRDRYIAQSLSGLFGSSIVFVVIILLCFAASIFIIFRQKKLSDLKTDFINNMTHELKTPVATISLAAEMLKNPKVQEQPDKLMNYANVITKENARLSTHIERVLQFARYDRGEMKIEQQPIDIHELLHHVTERFNLIIQNEAGQLTEDFKAQHHMVIGDKEHLHNVFNNLMDNAIKYKKEKPIIHISTKNEGKGIIITVADEGIGMTKDVQKKIFEKFYRVPTGNIHNVKGFGLGLAYVKAMIQAHMGHIAVESELNHGSRFIVYLPFKT